MAKKQAEKQQTVAEWISDQQDARYWSATAEALAAIDALEGVAEDPEIEAALAPLRKTVSETLEAMEGLRVAGDSRLAAVMLLHDNGLDRQARTLMNATE